MQVSSSLPTALSEPVGQPLASAASGHGGALDAEHRLWMANLATSIVRLSALHRKEVLAADMDIVAACNALSSMAARFADTLESATS